MFSENFWEKKELIEESMQFGVEFEWVYSLKIDVDIVSLVLHIDGLLRDKQRLSFYESFDFEYFDTRDDDIWLNGGTFRCVSLYKNEYPFRYDIKGQRKNDVCRESEIFTRVELSLAEIKEVFEELNVFQGDIISVALSSSYHVKWLIDLPQDTQVEVSLDIHRNPKTMDKILVDVEFEFKKGQVIVMTGWTENFVRQNFPEWKRESDRKYSRIRKYYESLK